MAALVAGAAGALVVTAHSQQAAALQRAPMDAAGAPPVSVAARRGADAFAADSVLLEFRRGVPAAREHAIERAVHARGVRSLAPGRSADAAGVPLEMKVSAGRVRAVVSRLHREPAVLHAEPNWLMQASATPDDPDFQTQWADSNVGQVVPVQNGNEAFEGERAGTPGDDANVLKAWEVTTGNPEIVVGEVDVGVDYEHPDLKANIWSNPEGILRCKKGSHGFNVLNGESRCEPMDTESAPPTGYGGHGTHVAGIIGAVGNNGRGVAGINWHTTILPVKWLSSAKAEWGEVANLIEGLETLREASEQGVNVRVVNDSAVSSNHEAPEPMLRESIEGLGKRNILFVTAAGNSKQDDDNLSETRYPCFYDLPNELCATASNDEDELAEFANYGVEKVNLAAPGQSIYSTLHNGPPGEESYGYLSGGSMAAAQVSGAAALILSSEPSLSAQQLKEDIDEHVRKVQALAGKVSSGGILNVCDAIPACLNPPPPPPPPPITTPTSTTSTPPSSGVASSKAELQVPAVTLAHAAVTASRHSTITLVLRCATTAARCTGTVKLRLTGVHVTRHVDGHVVRSTTSVTIASASFSIAGGGTRTLTLHLSSTAARSLLAQHRTLHTASTIVAHGTDGSVHTTLVKVLVRPPRH